jgi:hypothetical protein
MGSGDARHCCQHCVGRNRKQNMEPLVLEHGLVVGLRSDASGYCNGVSDSTYGDQSQRIVTGTIPSHGALTIAEINSTTPK